MKRYRIITSDKYTTLEESINDFSEIHIIDNIQYQDADPDYISVLITYDTDNDDRARQITQEEANKTEREEQEQIIKNDPVLDMAQPYYYVSYLDRNVSLTELVDLAKFVFKAYDVNDGNDVTTMHAYDIINQSNSTDEEKLEACKTILSDTHITDIDQMKEG